LGDTTINERVAIYCCAYLRDKQVAFAYLAAIEMQTLNLLVRRTDDLDRLDH
jgi:hypothetical protein